MLSCLSLFIGVPLLHLVCFSIYTLRIYVSTKLDCSAQKESENGHMKREISARDVELRDNPRPKQVYTINASNAVRPESRD